MDEKPILDRALALAKGDPNPHNFLYPTLYFYALFLWEALYLVVGRALGWFDSVAAFRNAYFVDGSGHILAARLLTVVCGTATVLAVYWFGHRLFGRAVGLAAAAFLALAPIAVRDAHYVKLDVPVTLFAVLAHVGLAAIAVDASRARTRRAWIVAGMFAGLAISTQYYAAFLAVPFAALALAEARQSGEWLRFARLLLWAGLATVCAFVATSPFFALEPGTVVRDFRELREVDIDRAMSVAVFSSAPAYARILATGAVGFPVAALSVVGVVLACASNWRRGLVLCSFTLAFLAFVSNTFPASRYLNVVIPCVAVAAGYAASRIAALAPRRFAPVMAAICVVAATPACADSLRWDRFFGQDDTRTLARAFIEREVRSGSTIAMQPYSAPIRQSRDGLIEALRAKLGDESRAPLKYRLQLAASPYPAPAFRILYLGESGKTLGPPADVDKIYLPLRRFVGNAGLEPLREADVDYVVLTFYGFVPPALRPLADALHREGRLMARFTPYASGIDPASAPVPPFRHNGNTWIHPLLERPGPLLEIWRIP